MHINVNTAEPLGVQSGPVTDYGYAVGGSLD